MVQLVKESLFLAGQAGQWRGGYRRRAADMLELLYRGRTEEVCDQLAHADGAVAVGANQEAIDHLQSALAVITEHPEATAGAQQDTIRLKLAGLHFIVGEL